MARYRTTIKPKTKPKRNLLPLWLALGGLGFVLFAAWALWSSNAPTKSGIEVNGAPRLKVDKETIDHGDVKLGTPVRDDIRVTNTGDQPLRFIETPYIEVLEGC